MMPGENGIEVCQKIKSASATAQLPIIMVTALDQASDKVRGLQARGGRLPDQTRR